MLSAALTAGGLVNYPTEWWHWSFGDRYWALATEADHAVYGPRRLFLRAGAATRAALAVGTSMGAQPAAVAPGGFPDYTYARTVLTASQLKYNPTGESIFPCLRGVYDKLSSPLGRYYLYYAPHDAPGGICLAYGNSLAGPLLQLAQRGPGERACRGAVLRHRRRRPVHDRRSRRAARRGHRGGPGLTRTRWAGSPVTTELVAGVWRGSRRGENLRRGPGV